MQAWIHTSYNGLTQFHREKKITHQKSIETSCIIHFSAVHPSQILKYTACVSVLIHNVLEVLNRHVGNHELASSLFVCQNFYCS